MVDSIVAIANMNSRSHRQNKNKIKMMRNIVGNKGEVLETKNLDELVNAIHFIIKYKPQVMYPDGGDGMHLTTETVFREEVKKSSNPDYNPNRAVFKDGTWNVKAKYVGNTKGNTFEYLKYIVKNDLEDLATANVGVMKISDDRGKTTYGFSFGLGMPITLLKEAYKAKYLKVMRVAQVIAHLLGSAAINGEYYKYFAEKNFYQVSNGNAQEENVELLGLMAQTVPSVGLPWSNIFYKAGDTDKFHVLGAKHDIIELMALSPALYFGKTNFLKNDLLFASLDVRSVLALLPALSTGYEDIFNHKKFIDKHTENYCIKAKQEFEYTVNGDLAFMDDVFIANYVKITGGNKMKIIKFLG